MIKPPAARYALTLLPLSALLPRDHRERSRTAHTPSGNSRDAGSALRAPPPSALAPQSTTRPQILGDTVSAGVAYESIGWNHGSLPRSTTCRYQASFETCRINQSRTIAGYLRRTYSPVMTAPELSHTARQAMAEGQRHFAREPSKTTLLPTPSRPSIRSLNPFPSDQISVGTALESPSLLKAMKLAALIAQSPCGFGLFSRPTRANVLLVDQINAANSYRLYSILSAASMTSATRPVQMLVRELMVPDKVQLAVSLAGRYMTAGRGHRLQPPVRLPRPLRSEAEITADRNTRAAFLQTFFGRTKRVVALPNLTLTSHSATRSTMTRSADIIARLGFQPRQQRSRLSTFSRSSKSR